MEFNLKKEKEKLLKLESNLFRDADEISQSRKKIERYKYLLQDNEIVARVFFQYFAKRSGKGNEKVLGNLSQRIRMLEQFKGNEFKKVEEKIKKIISW